MQKKLNLEDLIVNSFNTAKLDDLLGGQEDNIHRTVMCSSTLYPCTGSGDVDGDGG